MLASCSSSSASAPSGNTSAPGRPERARTATTPHSGHGSANSTSSRCSSSRSRDGSAGSWSNVASAAPPSKSEHLHSGRPSPPERRRTQPIPGSMSGIEHRSCSDNCNAACCHTKQLSNIAFRVQVRHSVTDAAYRACNCSTTPPPRPPDRPPARRRRRRESGLGRAESVIVEFPRSVLGDALACCGTSFHESARSSRISERDTVIVFRGCRNTARIARNSVPHERPFSGTTCATDRGEGKMCTAPRARTAGNRTDATAGPAGTDAPRGRSKSMKSDAVTAMSPPPPTGLPLRRRHTTSPGAEPWA